MFLSLMEVSFHATAGEKATGSFQTCEKVQDGREIGQHPQFEGVLTVLLKAL